MEESLREFNTGDFNLGLMLEEGEIMESAVAIIKTIDPEGDEKVCVTWTEGLGFLERAGMLRRAEQVDYNERLT